MASRMFRLNQFLVPSFLLLTFVQIVNAVDPYMCWDYRDSYVGNAQDAFNIISWVDRGICVHTSGLQECYSVLETILDNLNNLRSAEFTGAAGVLALLPTIGALMGAPTSEIWRLFTVLPYGGVLAMFLSFGGAIMPVDASDYEHLTERNSAIGSIVSFRKGTMRPEDTDKKLEELREKVNSRIDQPDSQKVKRWNRTFIYVGGMVLLLAGAHFGMAIVEQGSVIPWWCNSSGWFHMWYFLVTFTAALENYARLPFIRQHRLFISSLPKKLSVRGGDEILPNCGSLLNDPSKRAGYEAQVRRSLTQSPTLNAATVENWGSWISNEAPNSVIVLLSIVGDMEEGKGGERRWTQFLKLFSKGASITVFVCGTAIFASVTLLALEAAIMILTITLSSGIFGRALAGWMVSRISRDEPLIHVIASEKEEYQIIGELLCSNEGHQIEIGGQVFVNRQRVCERRLKYYVPMLGIDAKPYNLKKIAREQIVMGKKGPVFFSEPEQPSGAPLLGHHHHTSGNAGPPQIPSKVTPYSTPPPFTDYRPPRPPAPIAGSEPDFEQAGRWHISSPGLTRPPPSPPSAKNEHSDDSMV